VTWLVELRCTHCGAPGRFLGEQLIAICQYCGHVISAHRVLSAGHHNLASAEIRSFVVPTLTDVRRLELSDLKYAAIEKRDAEVMHAATLELAALDAIEAGLPADAVATWARWSAAVEQVATFEPIALFTPSVERFTASPASYTTDALSRQATVFRDVISSPAFPVDLVPAIAPEVAAMDAVLASLRAWIMFAPYAAFTEALVALGQRAIVVAGRPLPCRTCGAPLTASALATLACEYCRSALEVRRHLWLDSLLRTVEMANLDTLRADERAAAALGMLTATMRVRGNDHLPEPMIVAYVDSLAGIERGATIAMLALMLEHHPLNAAERRALSLVQQHVDRLPVAVPPPPGRRVGSFVALDPSEAWRRAMLRNWRRMLKYASVPRDQIGLVAANQLLPPLAGGYLPDPADAATFLRAIEVPVEPIRAAIALHRMGEHDPDKAAFWDATAAALQMGTGPISRGSVVT
jgi:DNA-directed RNA polymerase subunit RPC12/RpoP